MVNIFCVIKDAFLGVSDSDTLEQAILEIRNMWNEDNEPQCYVFRDAKGRILATMLRPLYDPEIAITTYGDGRIEKHRCKYILDDEDRYIKTEITRERHESL